MTPRLNLEALARLPAAVRRPDYDFLNLGTGIVHLGIGAFHRAHQAVYTEDAIRFGGGDWGILGVSLRHATVADALAAQNGLYTLETLGLDADYRVVAAIRGSLCALPDGERLQTAIAAPRTHIVTLTVTEKGYCLGSDGALDFLHSDIAHDLLHPDEPNSAIAWLVRGLSLFGHPASRRSCGGGGASRAYGRLSSCHTRRRDRAQVNIASARFGMLEIAVRSWPKVIAVVDGILEATGPSKAPSLACL